jgi:2-phospho-L-lactate guanylyltransferase (CobY/MobA/RfbA family)
MTTVLVLADPPHDEALSGLSGVLTKAGRRQLARAFLQDVIQAADAAAGDMLVAVRDGEAVGHDRPAAEEAVREAIEPADGVDAAAVRIERQVGSTPSARLGNAVTHLLEEEGADSVVSVWPRAPMLGRADIDGAAMKLRQRSVVVGPASRGRVALAAFRSPVDFTEAMTSPAVLSLTTAARDADLEVDFIGEQTLVDTHADLTSLVAAIRARLLADRLVPPQTTAAISELGLRLSRDHDTPTLVTD